MQDILQYFKFIPGMEIEAMKSPKEAFLYIFSYKRSTKNLVHNPFKTYFTNIFYPYFEYSVSALKFWLWFSFGTYVQEKIESVYQEASSILVCFPLSSTLRLFLKCMKNRSLFYFRIGDPLQLFVHRNFYKKEYSQMTELHRKYNFYFQLLAP